MSGIAILLPAHNEAAHIDACLRALLTSDPLPDDETIEILILANGCTDTTAKQARAFAPAAGDRGWQLRVIELAQGDKLQALTHGDRATQADIRIYLDADVLVTAPLISQIAAVLQGDAPRYASGQPRVAPARTWITRAYGRFWTGLPFVRNAVPGFGLFAMNSAGRARWGDWPDIISDDTFARLNFTAGERIGVRASYSWPMVEGFANLVRVRRRQNLGVQEIATLFPQLLNNDDKEPVGPMALLRMALRDPLGFLVYGTVAMAVKTPLFASETRWTRGR